MPIVDENRLKGNQGASLVASWLSERCLVRPVAEGTDVGIDLFCETVDESSGQPHMHFWVQVKAGKQVRIKDGKAKCSFGADHIDYWARQPVPVYAFLIAEGQLQDMQKIFVISFARKLLKGQCSGVGKGTRTLESDLVCYTQQEPFNLSSFVDTTVRVDHVVLAYVRHGLDIPMPQLSRTYAQQGLEGFRAPHAAMAVDQIRRSASSTIRDIVRGGPTPQQERQLNILARTLSPYVEGITSEGYWQKHYEDYWALGLYCKHKGQIDKGNSLLQQAREIILADQNLQPLSEAWQYRLDRIEDDLAPEDI